MPQKTVGDNKYSPSPCFSFRPKQFCFCYVLLICLIIQNLLLICLLLQVFIICIFISCILTAKEREITFLREAFFAKDKEISDLKEKLSQLQQSWQRNQLDFVKRTAATEEKFHEARKTIDELKGGANLSVMRNTTKSEESQSGLQFFNGEYVAWNGISVAIFSLQASQGNIDGKRTRVCIIDHCTNQSFHNSEKI